MNRTHYVRANDLTLVDAETSDDDLSVYIDIDIYTRILLPKSKFEDRRQFCHDTADIQKLRQEYFEGDVKVTPTEFVKDKLNKFCKKWGLGYAED